MMEPNALQRAALLDASIATLHKAHGGHWHCKRHPRLNHAATTILACRRRGWLASNENWQERAPHEITIDGLDALLSSEGAPS